MKEPGKESSGDVKTELEAFIMSIDLKTALMDTFGNAPVEKKLPLWMSREEFVKEVENRSMTLAIQNKEDYFSTANLDSQLAHLADAGIVMLRTKLRSEDLEEFAARKVGDHWKFSFCHQMLDDIKYGRVVEASTR